MTPQAIRDGFDKLRTDEQMQGLAAAARSRSEADWLVGINGTRAMTAFNSRDGGFFLTTVGRVQTPTLSIVVEREEKIRKHVRARLLGNQGHVRRRRPASTTAKWIDPAFKKDDDRRPPRRPPVGQGRRAEAIAARRAAASPARSPRSPSPARSASPLLYDLTSLQREANGRFGFSAKTTLSLAQALYEKHKVLTYPRTDSRALPEDYLPVVKDTLKMLATEDLPGPLRELGAARRQGAEGGLRQADQAHLRQRQGVGSLRHHPHAAGAEVAVRHRGQALRPGRQALHRRVLPERRIPGHHAPDAGRRAPLPDQRQGAGEPGLAGRLRQGGAGRRRRRWCRCRRTRWCATSRWRPSARRRGRRRATTKARCCRRWKARAS